jgi:hypothetical protein
MAQAATVGHSRHMGILDATIRKLTRSGLGLAGTLIYEVQRRRGDGARRTPAELLIQDSSGLPGPALIEPVADWDMLLIPHEVDPDQAKDLARAAARTTLDAAAERLVELAREFPENVRAIPGALAAKPWGRKRAQDEEESLDPGDNPGERAAWERFLSAYDAVADLRAAYNVSPCDLTAEELRLAEVELEDAVAVAGELEVHNIRWILA